VLPQGASATTTRNDDERSGVRTLGAQRALRFLARGAPWALLAALACGAAAFQVARVTPPTYRASVALLVSRPQAPDGVVAPPAVAPGAYRSALWDGGLVAEAFERVLDVELSDAGRERLERTVRVAIEDQEISSVVRIEVRHGSPDTAAAVADAIAGGLVGWDQDRAAQALGRRRDALTAAVARLEARLGEAPADQPGRGALEQELTSLRADALTAAAAADAAATVPAIEPLRPAAVPDEPVAPRPVFSTFVAVVLGLVGAYLALYLRDALDRRVGGPAAARELTGLPVLTVVPRRRAGPETRDAARMLRARLAGATRDEAVPVVVVSCPRDVVAKTGVAVALAEALAERGEKALLVDADWRHGELTRHLVGGTVRPGGIPDDEPGSDRPIAIAAGRAEHYAFLPTSAPSAQPGEAPGRLWSDRLALWREAYGTVIVDAPPLLPYADALALAPAATGVVLCLAQESTRRDDLLEALALLDEQGTMVLGLVVTRGGRRAGTARSQHRRATRSATT
jgi:Mrp family chromosome partitioning ATPase